MREVIIRCAEALLRALRRFIDDRPANPYESILFNTIRLFANQIGKKAFA